MIHSAREREFEAIKIIVINRGIVPPPRRVAAEAVRQSPRL